jgi:hypothetical protein
MSIAHDGSDVDNTTQPEFDAAVEAIARVLVPLSVEERSAVMNAAIDLAIKADRTAAAMAALDKALAVRDDTAGKE